MANDFVNTITTSNGTTYDVQDKRLTVTAADAGKVVAVDSNGDLSLITPSGGTKLYKHKLSITHSSGGTNITVLSTLATQITSLSGLSQPLITNLSRVTNQPGFMGFGEAYFAANDTYSYNLFSFINGSFTDLTITSISDTVTEL